MKKQIKIERVTCACGQVIAGCVHGQQDSDWESRKGVLYATGYDFDIVPVEDFKFGECTCLKSTTKIYFKVLAIKD